MVKKENPNIFIQNIMDEENRTIKINQSTINIIIQPYFSASGQNYHEVDFSLFTIKGLNPSYYTYENGTKLNVFDEFPIKPCEEKDFDESQKDFFRKNNFDKTSFCMGRKYLEVKGLCT
jgi:hypothetical protein